MLEVDGSLLPMTLSAGPRDVAPDARGNACDVVGVRGVDLVERMSDGFIALDREWRIVYMNRAARAAGQPSGHEVIGRSHWEQWPQTVGTEVERQYRLAMETQRSVTFEHCYTLPGAGREFWHRIHAYPDATGLSIFFRDVTEEKRTEDLARLLASASARFVSTLDLRTMLNEVASLALPLLGQWACVYLVDEAYRVTDVSYAGVTERLRQILRHVVKQLPLHAIDPRLPWNRAMHGGEPVLLGSVDDTFYGALDTPELRDFVSALAPRSLLCVPLVARGRTIGGITFGMTADGGGRQHDEHDILAAREVALPAGLALDTARLYDEQRRARHEAEEARRLAEEANHSKVDFLRAMSHEMRTPLNAIGGYVQLLRMGARGPLSPEVCRDLERMERNHQHVTGLINDVLHFARLEAGRVEFAATQLVVAQLMAELEDYVDPQDAPGALVVRPCAPDVTVWADADKVRQVLLNLIGNAIKHTPRGTAIEVFCPPAAAGTVSIAVRDGGPGIPAERQAAIFEPFVQIGRSLNHPVEGLGLGLAIARDLARGMGGDLSVSSVEGHGSTFTLTLPRL